MKMAMAGRRNHQRLVHHSDRGIQYCSTYYQALHQRHGVTCPMTDGYDCYQNALAERVNGIMKTEFLLQRPADLAQARRMVEQLVRIYNCEQPHLSLKMQTPDAVHRASLAGQPRLEFLVLRCQLYLGRVTPAMERASHTSIALSH